MQQDNLDKNTRGIGDANSSDGSGLQARSTQSGGISGLPPIPENTRKQKFNAFLQRNRGFFDFFSENKWAIWLIIGSLCVIAAFSWWLFRAPGPAIKPKVTLSIEAPAQTSANKETDYRVHIVNNDNATIKKLTLNLIYPSGFTFIGSSPDPSRTSGTQFDINQIDPGQNTVILIKGNLAGNSGETKIINAILHYSFADISSDFVAQAQSQSQITNSNIALQFVGPDKINNDQVLIYSLDYANTTSSDLHNLQFKITLPQNFGKTSFTPAPDSTQNGIPVWNISNLGANSSGKISVTGTFSGAKIGDQPTFSAEADGGSDQDTGVVLTTITYPVSVINVPLMAILTESAAGSGDVVKPGDSINFNVHYKNSYTTGLNGIIIHAVINGDAYDIPSLTSNGNIDSTVAGKATVSWDGSIVPALSALQPNQEGDLVFSVRIKNPATNSDAKDLTVSAHAEIQSVEFSQPFVGNDITMKIATVANINGTVAYSNGALPPQAGQNTSYIVTLSLRNSTSDITGGIVSFNLPSSTGFDIGSVNTSEQANVTYSPNTKKVVWNVGTLAAHTGDFNAIRKLQFTVNINPDPTSVGKALILVNNISMDGHDSFTGKAVNLNLLDLSTTSDPSGKGIVQ